jgi:hypothetical protein
MIAVGDPGFLVLPGKRKRGTSSWKITRSQAPRSRKTSAVGQHAFFASAKNYCSYESFVHIWIQAPQ